MTDLPHYWLLFWRWLQPPHPWMSGVNISDFVNGSFEMSGTAFVLLSVRRLLHDKKVRGVSIVTVMFFFSWGLWNLYYYPHLGQWWSFAGSFSVVLANGLWIALMVYYIRMEHGKT